MTMGVGVVDWPHGFAIIRDMTKPTKSAVILRWNPAFSSFGTESLVYSLGEMTSHPRGQMDWSVFDYKHVHKGDECYLLKVGAGPVGICLYGKILTEPYKGKDWSGKGRRAIRYVDLRPKVCINPLCLPILSTADLEAAIPDFNWRTGHSGEILTPEQSRKLKRLWNAFLADNSEILSRKFFNRNAFECNAFGVYGDTPDRLSSSQMSMKPYFYMVTLKRVKDLRPFCEITKGKDPPKDARGRVRYLVANELTEVFARVIREFHTKWWGLWPIECFIVMPDHLHLLIHIKDTGDQLALGKYVYQLMKALTAAYWEVVGMADGRDSKSMISLFE